MSEWKTYKLRDVVNILDYKRIPLSSRQREQRRGKYPYYGAQGIIDYIDDYIFDGTYLLVAEDGENLRSKKQHIAQLVSGKYWVNNHAHILESNGLCDIRYICYLLNVFDISGYITGSAQPKLNQANLLAIEISLPPLAEQKRIADILSAIDDKIELNRRINANLEQQAQALYKSWFVDNKKDDWEEVELGDIATILAGGDKPEIYVDKQTDDCKVPIYSNGIDNEGLFGYTRCAKIFEHSITISARGTIGFVCLRTEPYVPIVRLISVIPQYNNLSAEYLYLWAITQNISGTGTTQQQLTIPYFKKTKIIIPNQELLIKFNKVISPIFITLKKNKTENNNLSNLRDTLLPKLMSGDIKV